MTPINISPVVDDATDENDAGDTNQKYDINDENHDDDEEPEAAAAAAAAADDDDEDLCCCAKIK